MKKFTNFYIIYFEKDGFKVNYNFSSISMQRKKDLVRTVRNKREPHRNLFEENGTYKFCKICDEVLKFSQEFPEKYSSEYLRNF